MSVLPFYLVDVFAAAPYQGNQLAVFDARQATALTVAHMQAMAREINFQETTFVMGGSLDAGFDVRIFTPEYEVPFAGHPTLGTSWVIANRLFQTGSVPLTLQLAVGPIQVRWEGATPWLTAAQPRFGLTYSPADVAQLLNLPPDLVDDQWPIEWVSTGLDYVVVPVRSLDALRRVQLDVGTFEAWLLQHQLHKTNSPNQLHTSLYVVSQESYSPDNQLAARMFCLEQGRVGEDPATGSAGSCLLAYLLKNGIYGDGAVQVRVEQGYEIGRPSLLELAGSITESGTYDLQVGGQVQYVAAGEWALPNLIGF
ncbi:PhzF family phenazine biosynthesis protein [Fibrella sp. WM1]|uniref:PhzF family phenazine biosynthesis protein n=1 Tax=Fibrella musci TaxID=3242485 RepID=UPI003521A85C